MKQRISSSPTESLKDIHPFPVTTEQVKKVLDGGIVQVNPNGIDTFLLGLPIKTEMGTKAMFVEPSHLLPPLFSSSLF